MKDEIDPAGHLGDRLAADLLELPDPLRRAAALRVASRAVELAAFEAARVGDPKEAPKLILLANDLLRMASTPAP